MTHKEELYNCTYSHVKITSQTINILVNRMSARTPWKKLPVVPLRFRCGSTGMLHAKVLHSPYARAK